MRSLLYVAVLVCLLCLARAQMDVYGAEEYELYAVVDADDVDGYDIQQFGFGGAGFGGSKGLAALRNCHSHTHSSTSPSVMLSAAHLTSTAAVCPL